MYGFHQAQLLSNMAIGIFTLRQQLRGLLVGNWTGTIKTPYVEYLVVGGGGAGGNRDDNNGAGGGGAGGVLTGLLPVTTGTSYTVTVGGGGAAVTSSTNDGANGSNSVLGSLIAVGGGGGGRYNPTTAAPSGGSGGGGGRGSNSFAGGQGVFGQGNTGGSNVVEYAAGGGGAGTVGLNATAAIAGNGGAGIASAISGTVTAYGGGGGGAGANATTYGAGGVGGGGRGAGYSSAAGVSGTANTGGGGGGGTGITYTPGSGGSGIVIVSYPDIYAPLTTGGATSPTVSTSGSGSLSYSGSSVLYLGYGAQTPFSFGTGDFTIEFWVNCTNFTSGPILIDWRAGAANTTAPVIYVSSGGVMTYFTNSADRITSSAISTATWYHIVVCRTGTSTKMYINGTQAGSTYTDSTNYTVSTNGPVIGNIGGVALNGYMSNVRIVKGNCVYTGNFTSPTAPLTATQAAGTNISAITGTQTSLLLNTVSGSPLADSSTNSYAATLTGTTIAWNQLSPFATGLGYKNRVYTWAPTVSAGGTATGTFTV